jgi:hypothetical protein
MKTMDSAAPELEAQVESGTAKRSKGQEGGSGYR